MKKRLISLLLVVSTVLCMTACGKKEVKSGIIGEDVPLPLPDKKVTDILDNPITAPAVEDTSDYEIYEGEISDMSTDKKKITGMVDTIYENKTKKGNVILSETSLDMALGMAMQGASGECLKSFERFYEADVKSKGARDKALLDSYASQEFVELNLFNGVYTNEGIDLLSSYKKAVKTYYNADVEVMDFLDSKSADKINGVCDEVTNGLIDFIIDSSALADCQAVLLNALYFNGTWTEPFTESQVEDDTDFNGVNGLESITAMYGGEEGIYYESDTATAFSKSYAGSGFKFIGILPKESITETNGDFKLSDIDIDVLLESKTSDYDVYYMLPKFKVEDYNTLNTALQVQGLEEPFQDRLGIFENMSDTRLKFDSVIQKTVVDVNEEGTEAAAVTAIMMCEMAALPEVREEKYVYLDRPFAFMIYDECNDEVLFLGKIVTFAK